MLRRIEAYLKLTGMRPTRFGREAVRDARFVLQLRQGRIPRPATEARVQAFLDRAEHRLGPEAFRRRRR